MNKMRNKNEMSIFEILNWSFLFGLKRKFRTMTTDNKHKEYIRNIVFDVIVELIKSELLIEGINKKRIHVNPDKENLKRDI